MSIVYAGVGSNIGKKKENCLEAIRKLEAWSVKILSVSDFYTTLPAGGPPQENFVNGVIKIETEASPRELLGIFKEIERGMGRMPSPKNSPRIIDMDILMYDDFVLRDWQLQIPHPRMHQRSFVLKGLEEIAPDEVHPVLGKTVSELFRRAEDKHTLNIQSI